MTIVKTKSVDAVVRALSLLKLFEQASPELSLAEISRRSGIVKSTCMRMLISLAEQDMITITPDRKYTLGPEVYRLGKCYSASFRLEAYIRPVLKELVAESQEGASFFQRVGSQRMCLFREDSNQLLREHVAEGDTVALDKGAAGRVLLNFMNQDPMQPAPIRTLEQLPVVSMGERDSEINGIAAPVFSSSVGLVGAIAISGPRIRLSSETIRILSPMIFRAAQKLSMQMGARFYG